MILDNDAILNEGRQPEGPVKKKTKHKLRRAEYISTFLFGQLKRCKLQQEQDPPMDFSITKTPVHVHALDEQMRRSHIRYDMIQEKL
jgi:hypothetical protein